MVGNTSKNTDDAQKAYKKAKRQRRKLRRAEQKRTGQPPPPSSSSIANLKWRRVGREDGAKKAVDRPLGEGYDADRIDELLERRTKAKGAKDYEASDEITRTLVKLQIVYDDDKREWHTRAWKRGVGGGW
mmetsp:Transcript_50717/g.108082  ORF Transcript_50717/g.108082 Transcript_50717/m.108082 type:complete len:130 (-) Transcript_50717:16-405(-)